MDQDAWYYFAIVKNHDFLRKAFKTIEWEQ